MVIKMSGYVNEMIIPPGETIKEMLEDRGMTQDELAIRLDLSTKHVSHVINGKQPISHQTALKLENVFGVPASFWNNLERMYREKLARVEHNQEISKEIAILKEVPFKELVAYGYIKATSVIEEKVIAMRNFLGVSSLLCVDTLLEQLAFRKAEKVNYSIYAIAAWIKMCEIETNKINVGNFNKEKLKRYISEIRGLIGEDPDVFIPRLTEIFADCGIAFKLIRSLTKAPIQGMTKHAKDKVLLGMTIRGKSADIFWFSLFHELGHILLHNKKEIFIDLESGTYNCEKEREANAFAANTLIPEEQYKSFVSHSHFTIETIDAFSKNIGIHPCMVVGRLQKENLIRYNNIAFNSLKIKYEWVK